MLQMKRIFARKIGILYSKEVIILNNSIHSTESATYCPPGLDRENGDGNVIDKEIVQIATYPVVWSLWHLLQTTC